ncbi:hypothetical protein F0919_14930 [Taibaiella lutea]|uniref:Uncharacterized protein n=1 Tax=Taibaiella lutea TaxID=2608001 RepID=A0A5M6CAE5_9BACT|nr:hypothetical protein [Taibaiella lutea]KAA5532094.1 hypothetical protein F0919_14930 [Taibaiella lutea]
METAGIAELKKKLDTLSQKGIKELCLRLAKYKKENKELLSYLLFYTDDEETYIHEIKEEMNTAFDEINQGSLHWAKKSIRKILRMVTKYIKYSGNKQTEAELLIYFCQQMKRSVKGFSNSPTLLNLYQRQVQRIEKAVRSLHEDLQYDYESIIAALEI